MMATKKTKTTKKGWKYGSLHRQNNGSSSFIKVLSVIYLLMHVDVSIVSCNLDFHTMGQSARHITYLVLLLAQVGSILSSWGQRPAKSASTKHSTSKDSLSFRMRPLLTVPLRYYQILSSTSS